MVTAPETFQQVFREMCRVLEPQEGDQAVFVSRQLLMRASGKSATSLLRDMRQPLPEHLDKKLAGMVYRIMQGEPLAYVLGQWDFYGMTFLVTPDTLIPRDDTTAVVDLAVKRLKLYPQHRPRVLDLCCGTGCIGIALASQVPDARVTCGDISMDALAVCKRNIQRLGYAGRVNALQMDAKKPPDSFFGLYDLVISNPPYVTDQEMTQLDASVRSWEPHLALEGGADGLDFYREIIRNFTDRIHPGGYLAFEFGMGQGPAVEKLLLDAGYTIEQWADDSGGIQRAVIARHGEPERDEAGRIVPHSQS